MSAKAKYRLKTTLRVLYIIIAIYVCFILSTILAATVGTVVNTPKYYEAQRQHIASLEQKYASGEIAKTNEDDFTSFKKEDTKDIKVNRLTYLATHNSYKKELSPTSYFCFNYGIPFAGGSNGPTAYNYGFESLTDQLNNGIRSFEMDVNLRQDGKFECVHNTLLDNNSSCIDFTLTYTELNMWSTYNPNHLPVMILIEPKDAMWLFDTKAMTAIDVQNLGKKAKEVLGDKLYTPKDMLTDGGATDFKDMTQNDKYPTIDQMRGKIMFILHPSYLTDSYINLDKTMQQQYFFPVLDGTNVIKNNDLIKYSCFALSNDPKVKDVTTLSTDYNMIVRTRIDSHPYIKEADYNAGLKSNANILSSDCPPRTDGKASHVAYQDRLNKKTIILNDR
ncbi:MAG: Ca2+-dependent phosphoinositide-specific phospholipase C [Clostridia bacterium]|nr:Ca2+-dependent phosphoinositide-specific phospholipase C [Clostridia bacterium]MDY5264552.1 Ca2+-dependent phosphoinositide-specific phospholipase C [Eubacteriales bacterium]